VTRPTIRDALTRETPLVTPLAHDALSARLIELAGFHAFAIGGSALLAARDAYPDIGLIGSTDMAGSKIGRPGRLGLSLTTGGGEEKEREQEEQQ
jgi:2-methylisocitrate lyase-like PEP mutase family enzyme